MQPPLFCIQVAPICASIIVHTYQWKLKKTNIKNPFARGLKKKQELTLTKQYTMIAWNAPYVVTQAPDKPTQVAQVW